MKPAVVGGKLRFKGAKNPTKASNPKETTPADILESDEKPSSKRKVEEEELSPAEIRNREKKLKLDENLAKAMAKQSYRERIESYNAKLSRMTEHNDIPKISAAGNG